MSRDEYWNQDPYIVEEYLGAYKLEREEQNWLAWLSGIYVFDSVSAVLGNVHFDKRAHKLVKPMEKPIDIFPKTEEEIERENKRKINQIVSSLNRFHERMEGKQNAE
nr:MAG TPA: hypothetical protein [Bacteriophage sp.]